MTQIPKLLTTVPTYFEAVLFRTIWPETKNAALNSFFLMDAEENIFVSFQHLPTLSFIDYNLLIFLFSLILILLKVADLFLSFGTTKFYTFFEKKTDLFKTRCKNLTFCVLPVIPAGQMQQQPLFLEDPIPLQNGHFLQHLPIVNGLPNTYFINYATPPAVGGNVNLVTLAINMVNQPHQTPNANPPFLGPMPLNPVQLFITPEQNSVPDPALLARAAEAIPNNNNIATGLLALGAVSAGAYYYRKGLFTSGSVFDNSEHSVSSLIKIYSSATGNKISYAGINLSGDGVSFEIFGHKIMGCLPIICATTRVSEVVSTAGLLVARGWLRPALIRWITATYKTFTYCYKNNVFELLLSVSAKSVHKFFSSLTSFFTKGFESLLFVYPFNLYEAFCCAKQQKRRPAFQKLHHINTNILLQQWWIPRTTKTLRAFESRMG